MKRRLLLLAASIAALACLAVGPALAESATYTGPAVAAGCSFSVGSRVTVPAVGVGGACFVIPPGARIAAVSARDDVGGAPALNVSVNGAQGGSLGTATKFCSGSGTVALPIDAAYLFVGTDDPASAALACGRAPLATRGTITVSYG